MRIMTWNCRDNLSHKRHLLENVAPHIAIIQECSKGDATSLNKSGEPIWQAKQIDPNYKGLGILTLDPKISIEPATLPSEWLALIKR